MAKVDLFPDFRDLLRSFNSARIKYLLPLDDLKRNKQITGRHKDLADLLYLKDVKETAKMPIKRASKRKKR